MKLIWKDPPCLAGPDFSLGEFAENIKKTLRLDERFVVFEYQTLSGGEGNRIDFTVSSEFARERIEAFFGTEGSKRVPRLGHSIQVLPSDSVRPTPFAISNVSVVPVMKSPTDKSEQATQLLLGETADLLQFDREGKWGRIRLHNDGYVGWASRNQLCEVPRSRLDVWKRRRKVGCRDLVTSLYSGPVQKSEAVREFLYGTYLPVLRDSGTWTILELPDGRKGWLRSSLVRNDEPPKKVSSREIIATARKFLGISYIWGGRSVKGFDCSGFTQAVFRLNGIEIPRDTSLQWECGEEIGRDVGALVEGDLVFFGSREKLTHVGIFMGEGDQFVHASGFVRISSFRRSRPVYDPRLRDAFFGARRLGVVR